MLMKVFFTALLILINSLWGVSQKAESPLLKISGDCHDAIPLTISQSCKYGPTESPKSSGNVKEIGTGDRNSELSFTQVNNTAWYTLNIRYDGELTFEIVPADSMDDYDFLLYPDIDSNVCSKIADKTAKPLRSNMACNCRPADKGATGLSTDATQEFRRQGPGNPFSRSVQVEKGDIYMLALNNVTPNGKGHTIYFHAMVNVEIKGSVISTDSLPLAAEVLLADPKGETVGETTSDSNGNYTLKTAIERNTAYSLVISNDSSFIGTQAINTADTKDGQTFATIKTVLPKLQKGAKYPLGNINFYDNSVEFLPESYPSVTALAHLMKKNPKMRIQIEGHVNGAGADKDDRHVQSYFQELSERRARVLRNCLIDAGIAADRMTTIGYGATRMLFPYANTEYYEKANCRVEIRVISIDGD